MPPVWARWFQALFARVGGSAVGGVTDVSLAPLASPAFTGTPTAPTAAVGTGSTQVATTAFVIGQAASATPVMDGSAAAGASTRYARADHVHPTDTSRAPLASPAFTGAPTAPTPAAGDSSTKIATTAFVASALSRATVDVTAGAPGSVAIVGAASNLSAALATLTSPATMRVVRFTFATALPDTNYAVAISREYAAGDTKPDSYLTVMSKASASFDVGWRTGNQAAWAWEHIDAVSQRFSVLVYR
jgi:hypothetical protein